MHCKCVQRKSCSSCRPQKLIFNVSFQNRHHNRQEARRTAQNHGPQSLHVLSFCDCFSVPARHCPPGSKARGLYDREMINAGVKLRYDLLHPLLPALKPTSHSQTSIIYVLIIIHVCVPGT